MQRGSFAAMLAALGAGGQALILGASYSHVRRTQPEPGMAAMSGVNYLFYDTPEYQGNGMGRVKNIWSFCRQVWKDADILAREFAPDVVIASSTYPMDIWVARRIARRAGAVLVFEVHDLWPLSPIELSGMSPHHPFALLCGAAEKTAYRDADVVVSMLPKVAQHMRARGMHPDKLSIVPNGISPEDWERPPEPLRADGPAIAGYDPLAWLESVLTSSFQCSCTTTKPAQWSGASLRGGHLASMRQKSGFVRSGAARPFSVSTWLTPSD